MTLKRINHIEIIENIGAGGTAVIYKGVDTHTGFLVAVKELASGLAKNDSMKERFLQEANHYLYLSHPNIVKLKDFILKKDASYLVMEFIEGQNMEEYINKVTGPIPEQKAIKMIREVLAGVQCAHTNNVLHLDIKPSNIMVTAKEEIKLIDFGISVNFLHANKGSVMGSPLYMSPEQTHGKGIDLQTDIYSTGITFFQMLTGSTPLTGNMPKADLFEIIRKGNLPKAKTIYPHVSDGIQAVVDKAICVDKTKRFKSASEFSDALKPFK